jgi:hypothetical protein
MGLLIETPHAGVSNVRLARCRLVRRCIEAGPDQNTVTKPTLQRQAPLPGERARTVLDGEDWVVRPNHRAIQPAPLHLRQPIGGRMEIPPAAVNHVTMARAWGHRLMGSLSIWFKELPAD